MGFNNVSTLKIRDISISYLLRTGLLWYDLHLLVSELVFGKETAAAARGRRHARGSPQLAREDSVLHIGARHGGKRRQQSGETGRRRQGVLGGRTAAMVSSIPVMVTEMEKIDDEAAVVLCSTSRKNSSIREVC